MELVFSQSDADLLLQFLQPHHGPRDFAARRWIDRFRTTWALTPAATSVGDGPITLATQPTVKFTLGREQHLALSWLARRSSCGYFGSIFVLGLADLAAGVLDEPAWCIERASKSAGSLQYELGIAALIDQTGRSVPKPLIGKLGELGQLGVHHTLEKGHESAFPMSREEGDYEQELNSIRSVPLGMEDAERIEGALRSFSWAKGYYSDDLFHDQQASDTATWVDWFINNWDGPRYWHDGFGCRVELLVMDIKPLVWMAQRAACDADAAIFVGLQRHQWEPSAWDRDERFPDPRFPRGSH